MASTVANELLPRGPKPGTGVHMPILRAPKKLAKVVHPSHNDGGAPTNEFEQLLESDHGGENDPMISGRISPMTVRVEVTVSTLGRKGVLTVLLDWGSTRTTQNYEMHRGHSVYLDPSLKYQKWSVSQNSKSIHSSFNCPSCIFYCLKAALFVGRRRSNNDTNSTNSANGEKVLCFNDIPSKTSPSTSAAMSSQKDEVKVLLCFILHLRASTSIPSSMITIMKDPKYILAPGMLGGPEGSSEVGLIQKEAIISSPLSPHAGTVHSGCQEEGKRASLGGARIT
ncbi:hypothetical protein E2320_007848 [Naja naja]|nr:hypothetical protein E2320_007848 [Naja naja]